METFVCICLLCGKEFVIPLRYVKRGGGKYCSRTCNARANIAGKYSKENNHWKGGITKNNYHYKKLQVQRYPEKISARDKVRKALKSGKLVRGICEVCGNEKVQAHHDDYSKPLSVRWLCRKHHRDLDLTGP